MTIKRQKLKLVAVVVPLSKNKGLTHEEEISFRHLTHYLGNYDKYIIVPESSRVEYSGFGIKRFDDKFFGSVKAHTKLLLSSLFYKMFNEYKYILIYHLDSLVFSDKFSDDIKVNNTILNGRLSTIWPSQPLRT